VAAIAATSIVTLRCSTTPTRGDINAATLLNSERPSSDDLEYTVRQLMFDRLDDQQLSMTQETISTMLGVCRETVTEAAGALQAAGLIRYARGRIVAGLEHLGFEVQAAVDGQAGLASIQARQPDVVVIDFLMPGMNGAALGKAAQAQYPALPIVFVSGYSDTLALDGIANAVVLRKPFRIEDLHRAVRAVLDHDEQAISTFGDLA
jgi:CheY-like chemotaxis protein